MGISAKFPEAAAVAGGASPCECCLKALLLEVQAHTSIKVSYSWTPGQILGRGL